MNKAKQLALGVRGAVCPSCGRDNSEYGNICTADDCPGVNPSSRDDSMSAKLRERAEKEWNMNNKMTIEEAAND